MPRNDQVTRQWHLLRHLEASRGAALQELAAALPPDLSKHHRTIRRDLEALELDPELRRRRPVLGPPELRKAVQATAERICSRT